MAAQEDLYLMIGELYVAQRMLQDERDKLNETVQQFRIDNATLNAQIDGMQVQIDTQAADIELLQRKVKTAKTRRGGKTK